MRYKNYPETEIHYPHDSEKNKTPVPMGSKKRNKITIKSK